MPPSPSSRVALLVLAHSAAAVLERLAGEFLASGEDHFRILVHLDRKVDLDGYVRGVTLPPSVAFLDERHEIFWGGFSMIRATESLARAALADPSVGTCVLLSDDSLPLVSPDRIHAELCTRPDRVDVSRGWLDPTFESRYTGFFHFDAPAMSARPIEPHLRQVDAATLATLGRLARLQERGKFPLPRVWNGSQWWSLGRATLEPILEEIAGNEWLRESLEFAAVPDEIAFQTLYANRRGLTTRSHEGPMLTDMTRTPVPFVYRSIDEIPRDAPGKLFIRKIDPAAAVPVMEGLRARRGTG